MRSPGWLHGLIYPLAFALTLAAVVPAAAVDAPVQREQVLKILAVDDLSADYIVLLDTSGSMKDRWPSVRASLATFLSAMAPADHLSLITFDSVPAIRYSGPVGDSAAAVGQLPASPTGAKTDLGAAIEYGLQEAGRPDASQVQTILMVTDGLQDAPRGSAYPSTTGAAWDGLRAGADAGRSTHTVRAYALGLGGATDAAVLKSVYADAAIVALPDDQLPAYLERVKEETRIAKARQLLTTDLGGTVVATWSISEFDLDDGRADVQLTLASTTAYIPLTISSLAASVTGLTGTVSGLPDDIVLQPGETQTHDVTLTWIPPQEARIGRREITRDGSLQLEGSITTPWSDVLTSDLGLPYAPSLAQQAGDFAAHGMVGFSALALAALLGLLALVVAALALYRRSRVPSLRGVLEVTERVSGRSVVSNLALNGKKGVYASGDPRAGSLAGRVEVSARRVKPSVASQSRRLGVGPKTRKPHTLRFRVKYTPPGQKAPAILVFEEDKSASNSQVTLRHK